MKVLNPLREVDESKLSAGDLVVLNFGLGAVLAIVLRGEQAPRTYGVLRGPRYAVPTVHRGASRFPVLSYGSDAVLEVIPSAETASSHAVTELTPGMAAMGGGRLLLAFQDYINGFAETALYDAGEWLLTPPPPFEGRGLSWRIWASENDLLRPGATPVFEWSPPVDAQALIG